MQIYDAALYRKGADLRWAQSGVDIDALLDG